MNRIHVGPVAIEIAAPPALVFQMLSAIGQGAQRDGDEHLDGPVRGLRESITVGSMDGGGATVTYGGSYHPEGVLDHLRATLFARPAIQRVMRTHLADVRDRAEARAGRSRVFAPEPGA